MSRFPPEWLALREPLDKASRSTRVLEACEKAFENKETLEICDLGAGTGASIRALAHLLPTQQQWTLVDHDAENLKCAIETLATWGKSSNPPSNAAELELGSRHIRVETLERDLTMSAPHWPSSTELVTASALLDLVSPDWIAQTVEALSESHTPIFASLNFDGQLRATPTHPLDNKIFDAFRRHQRTDKGFGPAAGPDAPSILEEALEVAEYMIVSGDSPWRLNIDTQNLMQETLKGMSIAASEIGTLSALEIKSWLDARLSNTVSLILGHRDIFATPKPAPHSS